MTSSSAPARVSEAEVKAYETGAFVAGGVGLVTFVIGVWLGFNAASHSVGNDRYDDVEHPTLGIGVAIIVLTVAVSALAVAMCVVFWTLARPRRAALIQQEIRDAEQLAAEGW